MSAEDLDEWLDTPPYSLKHAVKLERMLPRMNALSASHYANCEGYRNIVNGAFGGKKATEATRLEDVPFLPVTMFKLHDLKSVAQENVVKTLTSSGTTGAAVSRISLDKLSATSLEKAVVKIMQHFLGKQRLPMVILDHKNVIRDRSNFSARGAGILGMAQFGRLPFYALREDDLSLDIGALREYLERAGTGRVFLFGFTFMVWQGLVTALEKSGEKLYLPEGILVHSGGWKKLQDQAVSQREFRERLEAVTGIKTCLNFYGMVEQVGGIFMENGLHYLHTSVFSHVIIRDPITLKPTPMGTPGLVQVLSVLPTSYPGHSILTEDMGVIHGVDDPEAGILGAYFEILGRVPQAELRGCSDTTSPTTPRR